MYNLFLRIMVIGNSPDIVMLSFHSQHDQHYLENSYVRDVTSGYFCR